MLGDIQELSTRDEVRVKSFALLLRFWVTAYTFQPVCLLSLQTKLPKEFSWPEKKLKISVLPDSVFDNPLQWDIESLSCSATHLWTLSEQTGCPPWWRARDFFPPDDGRYCVLRLWRLRLAKHPSRWSAWIFNTVTYAQHVVCLRNDPITGLLLILIYSIDLKKKTVVQQWPSLSHHVCSV